MFLITIDAKVLQLTGILLRQYKPRLAAVISSVLEEHPLPNTEVNIKIKVDDMKLIIEALNQIGEQWLKEKNSTQIDRDKQRQTCLSLLLKEWIKACEYCKQKINSEILSI